MQSSRYDLTKVLHNCSKTLWFIFLVLTPLSIFWMEFLPIKQYLQVKSLGIQITWLLERNNELFHLQFGVSQNAMSWYTPSCPVQLQLGNKHMNQKPLQPHWKWCKTENKYLWIHRIDWTLGFSRWSCHGWLFVQKKIIQEEKLNGWSCLVKVVC